MEEEKIKALFQEAASNAIEPKNTEHIIDKEEQLAKAALIVESGKKGWELVAEKMTGEYAEKFLNEMDSLSGREFIRVYSKMIEYFKPKVVRVTSDREEEEDNVIRIEIHNSVPFEDTEETIDIEHKEE